MCLETGEHCWWSAGGGRRRRIRRRGREEREGLERRLADLDTNADLWQSGTGCGNGQPAAYGSGQGGALCDSHCTSGNSLPELKTKRKKHSGESDNGNVLI